VGAILRAASADTPNQPATVAAIVDGKLRELVTRLDADAFVTPVTLADADGMRIYRRSLAFLLITAAAEVFPDAAVYIEHSAPTLGAYFCRVRGRAPFTADDLALIEVRMRSIVQADEPIRTSRVTREDAMQVFEQRGELDKAQLLKHKPQDGVVLHELRGRQDYLQGYMVPSTGGLERFRLHPYPPGFVLQYPHQSSPTRLTPFEPYPRLFATFAEAGEWLDRLGIRSAGVLNDAMAEGRLPEVSLVGEALHEARIARIAADIIARGGRIRVVLIAGPSSSGKTTFSKRLAVQLLAGGLHPFAVALDDYFVDRDRTPRDEQGELDFEALGAIDVPLINEQLLSLMDGRPTSLPRYSFLTGTREAGPTVT
jgi:uridine kinase